MAGFPFRSMRDWIEFLDEKGHLVSNAKEVDLRGEVSAICRKIALTRGPAVLHENIKGYPGWKILTDGLTTRERCAWALGVDIKSLSPSIAARLKKELVKPKVVDKGPCKEVKILGEDIDLTQLPIASTAEFDIPPYITAGMNICIDPETGWQNLALSRFQVKGKQKCGQLILNFSQTAMIFSKYVKLGKPMPSVVVIGADPIYTLLTQVPAPPQVDEVDYWAAFAGQPLEMVRAETCDILVPATAEIVLEGEVDPVDRELEGPFSEYTSHYSGVRYLPVFRVKAITMRSDAIYRHMYMASLPNEGHDAACMMIESLLYTQIKALVPELSDVSVVTSWSNVTAVSIDKNARQRNPGLVRKLGMAAKVVPAGGYLKMLIVVDDDIDVRNLQELMWCFATKFQPSKDIYVIQGTPGLILDPSEPWQDYGPGFGSYGIFDCTEKPAPYDEPYKRGLARPPRSAMEKVETNWNAYGFK